MSRLLDGRILHDQAADGHRSGIEPVLLAASVPATLDERVLEGGTGSGAGLLCLAARVPSIHGVGVELNPASAAQATANFAKNGLPRLEVRVADLTTWTEAGLYDHAMANPPWHPEGTPSPDTARELARRGRSGLLGLWALTLGRRLRHHGTLTFVAPAAILPRVLAAFSEADCGSLALLPLWPRAGAAAKLMLVQGRRGGRGPTMLLTGLVLHEADGRFTPQAEAILRDGAALPL